MNKPEDSKQPDKPKEPSEEYKRFEKAMKQILSVSKEEALAIREEKPVYPQTPKRKRRSKKAD